MYASPEVFFLLILIAPITKKSSASNSRLLNCFESLFDSVDPDQTTPIGAG